jgi:hypothetical protein
MKKTKVKLPGTHVPDIQKTKPEVFIIESLDADDEASNRFEGQILCDMLRLCGKNPKYFYFQSKDELPHLVGLFRQSQYRYLHISCHASASSISTTNETLDYQDFTAFFDGHLQLRRLFCSACELGNKSFVKTMAAANRGMHSIIAPACDIQFDHAAAIWAAFYISAFGYNEKAMTTKDIRSRFESLAKLFPVEFFFASYHAEKDDWNYATISQ